MANSSTDLTCSFCEDRCQDPRLLPCQHSSCLSCLIAHVEAHSTSGNRAICGRCEESFLVPEKGAAALPMPRIDKEKAMAEQTGCPDPEHKGQKVQLYCSNHNQLVCVLCVAKSHGGCTFRILEEQAKLDKEKLGDLENVIDTYLEEIGVKEENNSVKFDEMEEQLKASKADMHSVFKVHRDKVQDLKLLIEKCNLAESEDPKMITANMTSIKADWERLLGVELPCFTGDVKEISQGPIQVGGMLQYVVTAKKELECEQPIWFYAEIKGNLVAMIGKQNAFLCICSSNGKLIARISMLKALSSWYVGIASSYVLSCSVAETLYVTVLVMGNMPVGGMPYFDVCLVRLSSQLHVVCIATSLYEPLACRAMTVSSPCVSVDACDGQPVSLFVDRNLQPPLLFMWSYGKTGAKPDRRQLPRGILENVTSVVLLPGQEEGQQLLHSCAFEFVFGDIGSSATGTPQVIFLNNELKVKHVYRGPGHRPLLHPEQILYVKKTKNLLVLDSGNKCVDEIDRSGNWLRTIVDEKGGFGDISCMSVNPEGLLCLVHGKEKNAIVSTLKLTAKAGEENESDGMQSMAETEESMGNFPPLQMPTNMGESANPPVNTIEEIEEIVFPQLKMIPEMDGRGSLSPKKMVKPEQPTFPPLNMMIKTEEPACPPAKGTAKADETTQPSLKTEPKAKPEEISNPPFDKTIFATDPEFSLCCAHSAK